MIAGKLKIVLVHICVWLLYIAFAILVYGYDVGLQNVLYETVVSFCISASVFYLHAYYLLPVLAEKRKYLLYVIGMLVTVLYNFGIRYLFAFCIDPVLLNRSSSIAGYSIVKLVLVFSWYWFTFALFSLGYWLARRLVRVEKEARRKEFTEAERARLQLENAALRAQINPHFFVNTMNAFRVEVAPMLPETAKGIEAMILFMRSSMMRPDGNGTIALDEEVAAIESLITIYQRRFPNANIRYHKEIEEDLRIVPHIFAAFVENAFKHGSFTRREKPLTIELRTEDNDLLFHVHNWKSRRIKDDSRGIGLNYIRRQLEDAFAGRYELKIEDKDSDYTVSLKIKNIGCNENKLLYTG
ncbi:sensor histidine kinase [Taibaiella koreensis]|uniref:sensor histidine kinase n=1 Tax=Taibaiella koreensis TaxID=1268548 RepID=UPI000E59B2B5|nr:histidine kinase [Taibaiella koreensis]